MNGIRRKILLFLSGEYYLFWVMGLTAGVYAAGFFNLNQINLIINIIPVIALLAAELITVKRIIYRKNFLNIYPADKLYTGSGHRPEDGVISGHTGSKYRILAVAIIPFFIFFFTGNLFFCMNRLKDSKNIFLNIYKISNSAEYSGNDIIALEGRISNHPVRSYSNLNFTLAADKVSIRQGSNKPPVLMDIKESINVKSAGAGPGLLERDDYIRLAGILKKNNPGYHKESGCSKNYEVILAADYRSIKKIDNTNLWNKVFIFRSRLYRCLKTAFYKYLKNENACMAEALILGNRNNVPFYIIESFKRCGIYHLFAISGLHLSFIISFICLIFKRIRSSNYIFGILAAFLAVYNFLVGERASILRASIAAVLILLAGRWRREHSRRIILYFSYIILILYNPYFFYEPAFWMSFISMAALVFIYPLILKIFLKIPVLKNYCMGFFMKTALITLSIQSVMFPVLAYFFGEISLISLPVNVITIPLFYILISILIVSSFIIVIWPPAGGFILKSSGFFSGLMLKAVKLFERFDFCIINLNSFGEKNVLAYYVVFFIILIVIHITLNKINTCKGKL